MKLIRVHFHLINRKKIHFQGVTSFVWNDEFLKETPNLFYVDP